MSMIEIDKDFSVVDEYIAQKDWKNVMRWAEEHHNVNDETTAHKVIECYTLCMEQKIPEAFLNLGTFYYNGRFVEQDFKKAFDLYKVAADAGEIRAICNCGYCYYYGRHQEPDFKEAAKYFNIGAVLYSDANCFYKLGDLYLSGKGVDKNERYAFRLYELALQEAEYREDECIGDAQFRMGKCLLRGIGTEQNVEGAHALLTSALSYFYKRRKTDPCVSGLIMSAKDMIKEAQDILDSDNC